MSAPHDLSIQIRSVCFVSRKLDLEAEPEDDIDPIRGQSLLAWLRPRLEGLGHAVDGPDTEDRGWYLEVRSPTSSYIVGAHAIERAEGADRDVHLSRQRSFREWITGKGWITRADPLVRLVERIVREETEATEVRYEALLYAGPWRRPPWRSMRSPDGDQASSNRDRPLPDRARLRGGRSDGRPGRGPTEDESPDHSSTPLPLPRGPRRGHPEVPQGTLIRERAGRCRPGGPADPRDERAGAPDRPRP